MVGITRFFVTKSLREQAVVLVAQFMEDILVRTGKTRRGINADAIDGSLNQLYVAVAIYIQEHKLGAVRRAAFAFAIQDALQEQKFSPEAVSKVTGALVMNALVPQKR